MTVHNEILKRRPDLAPVMAAPWYMDRKGEVPEGKQPYFQIPIFNYFKVGIPPDSTSPGQCWCFKLYQRLGLCMNGVKGLLTGVKTLCRQDLYSV